MAEPTKKRILIVEDHVDVADMEKLLCQMEGYDVTVARTGDDAWASFQESTPDLILLDLMLPGALTGHDLLKRIRAQDTGGGPPVLVISALVNANTTSRLEEPGRVEAMSKPFRIHDLAERVRAMLTAERPAQ